MTIKTKRIELRCSPDFYRRLHVAARASDLSVAALIRLAVVQHLDKMIAAPRGSQSPTEAKS